MTLRHKLITILMILATLAVLYIASARLSRQDASMRLEQVPGVDDVNFKK